MSKFFKRFLREEDGATALEYGLLVALVALVMATGAAYLGGGLAQLFGASGEAVEDVTPPVVPEPMPYEGGA